MSGVLLLIAVVLAGCGGPGGPRAQLESPGQVDLSAKNPQKIKSRGEGPNVTPNQKGKYLLFPGDEQGLADNRLASPPGINDAGDGKFTVNVDRAGILEASKLILGETLGLSYVVDPRVQGTVTLSSSGPLSARDLLRAFEAALRLNSAALVQTDGVAKVVALQEMLDGEVGAADMDGAVTEGYGVSAVVLRHISPPTMMELMDSFIAHAGSVRASNVGNLILIRGSASERQSLVDVVLSFDVDWMRSQTASIAILSNGRSDDMAKKLEAIFADDSASSGRNAIKIIPVERLNGVIVIANSQQKVRRALAWIKRLDQESTTDTNYYVYAVQNGSAVDLAKILTSTFVDAAGAAGTTAEVAPNRETVQVSIDQSNTRATTQSQDAQTGKTDREDTLQTSSTSEQTTQNLSSGIRITANPANNTIVIRASAEEYRKILSTLRQIDAPATQVLINTTIAEVALNDDLRYGVQAFFKNNNVGGGLFTGSGLTLQPSFPGLNFFLGSTADPKLVLDALTAVTKVRIVSSPSVLVLENETATIKVGDQVPVKTQTVEKSGNSDSVNSFEYRDTGVILKVKPRVNANGMVTIELGQELSSVTEGSGSSTTERENPTFSQRAINSKVSVNDAQTVLLGGLISGQESNTRDTIPGTKKIPILGDLLGKTEKSARRTELIVFITPQIIRNGDEASRQSQDLRAKMKLLNWD
ncbi:MAG: type II secretion system secretin GspD [Alphaproteobacteria bacterium]|nr:type II secretion system secretin GspD [Alphaproteobacteria bacterium]